MSTSSDHSPEPDDAQDAAQAPGDQEVTPDEVSPDDATDDANPGREAAKYRRQLRDAEKIRDTLAARVQKYQTAEAERAAAGPGRLLDPTDLWRVTELADVVGDDGELDPAKVNTAVDKLLEDKPHYGAPQTSLDLDLGVRGAPVKAGSTWADVIGPPRR